MPKILVTSMIFIILRLIEMIEFSVNNIPIILDFYPAGVRNVSFSITALNSAPTALSLRLHCTHFPL